MARYPAAQWRPLAADESYQGLMTRHDGIVLHTMVGSLDGTDAYFRQAGYSGTESHFGVGGDGRVYQWVDTARRSDANLDGTWRLLSIETADHGPEFPAWGGSDVPAWTDAQLEAIARIIAWAAEVHDFPITAMPDSRPDRRGVGWHRQGCAPWRVGGGEAWSDAYGKVCPGDRRIAQIPRIIARAKALAGGDDMPTPQELLNAEVAEGVTLKQRLNGIDRVLEQLQAGFAEFRGNERGRDAAAAARDADTAAQLERLEAQLVGKATGRQATRIREAVRRLRADLAAAEQEPPS